MSSISRWFMASKRIWDSVESIDALYPWLNGWVNWSILNWGNRRDENKNTKVLLTYSPPVDCCQ